MPAARITNLNLRIAVTDDLSELERLITAAVDRPSYTEEQKNALLSTSMRALHLLVPADAAYIAQVEDNPAGCGGWSIQPLDIGINAPISGGAATIYAVFVHPAWSHRGIGKQIIKTCELAARRAGMERVVMATPLESQMLPLSHLYLPVGRTLLPLDGGDFLHMTWFEKLLTIP